MWRKTRSLAIAVERAAKILEPQGVKVKRNGKGWILQMGDGQPMKKRTANCLAHLAEIAAHRGVSLNPIRWLGPVPLRGLAGWEESALQRIILEEGES